MWRHTGWWRRIPAEFRVALVVATTFALAFFGAVVPLLTGGKGAAKAEVNGQFPSRITAGQTVAIPLAIDNTGDSVIGPFCVKVTVDPAATITPLTVNFQGLDTVPFTGNLACGGSLSGGEVISATVVLRGTATGSARVTTAPVLMGREVGPARSSIIAVVAPAG